MNRYVLVFVLSAFVCSAQDPYQQGPWCYNGKIRQKHGLDLQRKRARLKVAKIEEYENATNLIYVSRFDSFGRETLTYWLAGKNDTVVTFTTKYTSNPRVLYGYVKEGSKNFYGNGVTRILTNIHGLDSIAVKQNEDASIDSTLYFYNDYNDITLSKTFTMEGGNASVDSTVYTITYLDGLIVEYVKKHQYVVEQYKTTYKNGLINEIVYTDLSGNRRQQTLLYFNAAKQLVKDVNVEQNGTTTTHKTRYYPNGLPRQWGNINYVYTFRK